MLSDSEMQLIPNGSGALFEAINSNATVKEHVKATRFVQVIGVDNVLNRVLDPMHVGFSAVRGLEASLKCCVKRNPEEKVGVICVKNGKYDIIEYSEFSKEQSEKTQQDGRLYFELGNLLMFMLDSSKLIELCESTDALNKLYHYAFKKVEFWDGEKLVKPTKENAYKFELFLHNFLPFCDSGKFGVMLVDRNEEFAPVKNADAPLGSNQLVVDTPSIAKDLMLSQHRRWVGDKFNPALVEIDLMLSYQGEGDKL